MRTCCICGESKTLEEMSTSTSRGKRSVRQYCKKCKHSDDVDRRRRNKMSLIKAKGGVCIDCGAVSSETNFSIFDFHHTTSDKEFHDFARRDQKKALEEIQKCVLLCANCHRLRHLNLNLAEITVKAKWRHRNKKYINAKLGGKCIECKIVATDANFCIFDAHHIGAKDEKDLPSKSVERIDEEIKKCVLLCANCHRLEHSTIKK